MNFVIHALPLTDEAFFACVYLTDYEVQTLRTLHAQIPQTNPRLNFMEFSAHFYVDFYRVLSHSHEHMEPEEDIFLRVANDGFWLRIVDDQGDRVETPVIPWEVLDTGILSQFPHGGEMTREGALWRYGAQSESMAKILQSFLKE